MDLKTVRVNHRTKASVVPYKVVRTPLGRVRVIFRFAVSFGSKINIDNMRRVRSSSRALPETSLKESPL